MRCNWLVIGPACLMLALLGLVRSNGLAPAQDQKAGENAWRPLFNGKDLTGWETWLGRPHRSVEGIELKKNEKGEYTESVGLNKDPKNVYSVVTVDGEPALRISGEIWGAVTTKDEYENYQLRLEFKWGEKKWPPRDKAVRDSGILYHCVGPHGAAGTFWMQSQECQVQEHDCGDYWSVAGGIVDVVGVRKDEKAPVQYQKGSSEKFTVPGKGIPSRIVKSHENEKPTGQWNTMDVVCLGGTSLHVVNGQVNMVLTNSRRRVEGKEVPLTKGKIQLQSEGAEVFYRKVMIRPITAIPSEYAP
jgi:hypothetical protein